MGTTPRGIVFPANTANTEIWTHLENLATSADDAISVVDTETGTTVANVAGLAAVPSPFAGMRVWVTDIKNHAVYNGTAWSVKTQAGNDSITIAAINTAVSKTITFPVPYPSGVVPNVVVSAAAASVAHQRFASLQAGTITNTGFTCWGINTSNTSSVALTWIAAG